jgi:hypothetical protein
MDLCTPKLFVHVTLAASLNVFAMLVFGLQASSAKPTKPRPRAKSAQLPGVFATTLSTSTASVAG